MKHISLMSPTSLPKSLECVKRSSVGKIYNFCYFVWLLLRKDKVNLCLLDALKLQILFVECVLQIKACLRNTSNQTYVTNMSHLMVKQPNESDSNVKRNKEDSVSEIYHFLRS